MDATVQSLYFVTSSDIKFQIYTALLGMSNLERTPEITPDTKETLLARLASDKIEYVQRREVRFPCFIEQSGLVIDSWKGLPGGLSRLFIETLGDELLCKMLRSFEGRERYARIETVIYYLQSRDNQPVSFGGSISGRIPREPQGEPCYGWDRIFVPEGRSETFAQMGYDEKLAILATSNPVSGFRRFLQSWFTQVGTYDRVKLRDSIASLFTLSELQTEVLFPMRLELDALEGETTVTAKAVSLITYCERRGVIAELIKRCKSVRPTGDW